MEKRSMALSEQQVLDVLRTVQEPELGGDLVSRRMIKQILIDGERVGVTVELTTPACPLKDQIEGEVVAAVMSVGASSVDVEFTANVKARGGVPDKATVPGVAHLLAVASGKGGVGKSTVAVNTAVALAQEGARVGLLDADVYGPSAPLMLGVKRMPAQHEGKIVPLIAHGIKVMSVGFLIDDRQPVIWRGPMVSQLLRQFLFEVAWGELDYLVIDLPPGTGDIQLTLVQAAPLSGGLIVTTPQDVALADAIKGVEMFRKTNVPVLGIVENMSYFVAPDTGKRYDIFGHGGARTAAQRLDIPFLGEIPLGMSIRAGGDTGHPAVVSEAPDAYAQAFRAIAQKLAARISVEALA
jgi:ATP-binding protein involved in chromosome partitioning